MDPAAARELLSLLAVPRLPGTDALARVTDHVARRLQTLDVDVERQSFLTTSRRLAAAGLAGTGLGWTALLAAPLMTLAPAGWLPAVIVPSALVAVALMALGLAEGWLPGRGRPVEAVNLVGRRGAPRLWLVAHLDSKGQPMSLAGRVVLVGTATVGVLALLGLCVARLLGPLPWWLSSLGAAPAIVAGAWLSRGSPDNRSPGAVDNASGLIAALAAVEALRGGAVGVLFTSAEEFGMEGARAWASAGVEGEAFVNFDGLDHVGVFRLAAHGPGGVAMRRSLAEALRRDGWPVAERGLPPGVMVDGVVLARHGLTGVTVSRGAWSTLAIVHTARDTAARLDPASAVGAGVAVARAVTERLC